MEAHIVIWLDVAQQTVDVVAAGIYSEAAPTSSTGAVAVSIQAFEGRSYHDAAEHAREHLRVMKRYSPVYAKIAELCGL